GRALVLTATDRDGQMWDARDPYNPVPLGVLINQNQAPIDGAAFSPDSHLVATIGRHHDVALWDITDPRTPEFLSHLDVPDAVGAVFTLDADILVTGDNQGHAILWDVSAPRKPSRLDELRENFRNVNGVAVAPRGHVLATGDSRRNVRLWNVDNPRNPEQTAHHRDHTEAANEVAFSPDGHWLASTGDDWTVRLWHLTDTAEPTILLGRHGSPVLHVGFSPNGKFLITVSDDHTARIWDVSNPYEPESYAILTEPGLANAVFALDNQTVLTNGTHAIHQWPTDVDTVARQICATAGAPITHEEWTQYVGDDDYRPPCAP
ncbi:WD40 repeat domain-containing protein, partial [Kibdelosporangium lantanae]